MSRQRLFTVARLAIAAIVLAAVVYAIVKNWADVSVYLGQISKGTFALSTLAAAVGTVLTMLGWRVLLADLGSDLHVAPASGVYFVGQLGKYLPGSVWSVLVQADMARGLGVPRRRTAVTGFLAIGFALLAGGLIGLPAASLLLRGGSGGSGHFDWWVLFAVPIIAVLCVPRLLNAIIAAGLRLLRRPPLEHELSAGAVVRTVVVMVLAWVAFGVHILLLARAVSSDGQLHPDLTVASMSGYALSVSLGMLTVVLPAGLGAREGLLTLVLATALPTSAAAAVAITSRFIVTIVDVVAALAGWLYARSHHLIADRRAIRDRDVTDDVSA
ncbi:MAG: flippase-like domain-containing protein [Humibacillus sp.]|nr:flippase-like domain-containing protein [Humibacillus sp.]MDN5779613.1 flippase-like domain-containing protein [Humibacillus sp.]